MKEMKVEEVHRERVALVEVAAQDLFELLRTTKTGRRK